MPIPPPDLDVAKPLVVYSIGFGADWWSSKVALDAGGGRREVFAAVYGEGDGQRAAVMVAMLGLEVGIDLKLQKSGHRGWARGLRVFVLAVRLAVSAWNLHVAGKW